MMVKGKPKKDPDESELRHSLRVRLTLALWLWSEVVLIVRRGETIGNLGYRYGAPTGEYRGGRLLTAGPAWALGPPPFGCELPSWTAYTGPATRTAYSTSSAVWV